MKLGRILLLGSVTILGLCTTPARAEMLSSFAAFGSSAVLSVPGKSAIPEPSSGFLFFAGVAAIAGALEFRKRAFMR